MELTATDTGGAEFPSHGSMGEVIEQGMTLRDYFAAKALAGAWACQSRSEGFFDTDKKEDLVKLSQCFYKMADAMIEARKDRT